MPGNSTKIGPVPGREGSAIYPGFGHTVPAGFGRLQRLETGTQRFQRGGLRPTSGAYSRLPTNLLFTKVNGQQVIDISKVFIRKIGGASVAANTSGFAYTSTTTSLTWYWDGTNGSQVPVITRADGSRFTVPTAGSGLTISGLAINTKYYFLPFWNINNLCNIGWVPGTTGSPQIAFVATDVTDPVNAPFYLMQQTLQQNEPLTSGFMSASTTAGGTGGGGGGGGGGSGIGCVMSGTDIVTVGGLPYDISVIGETEWIHLKIADGRELYCTYDHPLYHAVHGKMRADRMSEGEWIITDTGKQQIVGADFVRRACSKHKIVMEKGHLYWANGFLSSNFKPVNPGT